MKLIAGKHIFFSQLSFSSAAVVEKMDMLLKLSECLEMKKGDLMQALQNGETSNKPMRNMLRHLEGSELTPLLPTHPPPANIIPTYGPCEL